MLSMSYLCDGESRLVGVIGGGRSRCAPRPFPLSHELKRLRSLRRKLVRAIASIDEVGCALRDAGRRWPVGAVALLEEGSIEGVTNALTGELL